MLIVEALKVNDADWQGAEIKPNRFISYLNF